MTPSFGPRAFLLLPLTLLTGCALTSTAPSGLATPAVITGHVHGGQSPVTGAHVFLFQAGNNGYGLSSTSQIGVGVTGTFPFDIDVAGNYVSSDSNGDFTLTGDYTCTAGSQVYVYATQGNPGLGGTKKNPALSELALLGTCPGSGIFPSTLNIFVDEVTTVAGVYALSGFMTQNATNVSSGSGALSITGLNNAFATAGNLASITTGAALTTTPTGGTAPQSKLNMLANIMAACVNSDGSTGATDPCGILFTNATADGTPSGAQPFDTAAAMLNIAHNPGANIAALYPLASPSSPFQPSVTPQPNDFTLAITFPLAYQPESSVDVSNQNPNVPSIDAAGDIVIPGATFYGPTTFVKNNLGADLANSANSAQVFSNYWAIDASGFGWSGQTSDGTTPGVLGKLTPSSAGITTSTPGGFYTQYSVSAFIGPNGYIYIDDDVENTVALYPASGIGHTGVDLSNAAKATDVAVDLEQTIYNVSATANQIVYGPTNETFVFATGGGLNQPSSLAVDSSGSIWATNGNNSLSKFTVAYPRTANAVLTAASGNSGYTGGGLSFDTTAYPTVPIVMDGASNAWIPNYAGQSVSRFTNDGTAVTPSTGYTTGCNSRGLAIDGSGNVWVTCASDYYYAPLPAPNPLVEIIGVATPVATPILPSQFGIRP